MPPNQTKRLPAVEVVLRQVGGRVPVFTGVSATDLRDSIALARHAKANGAAGILSQAPEALRNEARGLQDFFRRLADSASLTLTIQDLDWQGDGVSLELICRLFEAVPSFRCIKVETVPAGPKYSRILEATGGRLHVSGGWAADAGLSLEAGLRSAAGHPPSAGTLDEASAIGR
jgi:4-hydroxy-tetrahydrodipicolinate synthase